jgi:hypothetical protein
MAWARLIPSPRDTIFSAHKLMSYAFCLPYGTHRLTPNGGCEKSVRDDSEEGGGEGIELLGVGENARIIIGQNNYFSGSPRAGSPLLLSNFHRLGC